MCDEMGSEHSEREMIGDKTLALAVCGEGHVVLRPDQAL